MSDILAELFSSKVRAAVLERMLPRPHLGYSLTELSRLLDFPISSLQHECYKLERIGVLAAKREGSSRRYRVVADNPIVQRLSELVVTAIGAPAALSATLSDLPELESAFLAASLPLPAGDAAVPLVLIGEVSLEELDAVQARVAAILGVPASRVDVVFYRPADWRARLIDPTGYAATLLAGPRTSLIGTPETAG